MIKACIFDLDGTLADTVESLAYSVNYTLQTLGLKELPVNNFKFYAGDGARMLVRRSLIDAGDKACACFDQAWNIYTGFFKDNCTYKVKPFDGMKEALEQMKKRNIKIAVLSNKPHGQTMEVVAELFGSGFFDIIMGQKDGIPKKPDPTAAWMITEDFGLSPQECMYVGDTNVDMQTGNRAGMYTVGVLWGFRDREELEENHAQRIIGHPLELVGLLDHKMEDIT